MSRKSQRASRTKSRKHSKRQRSQRQRSQRQRRTRRHQGGAHALTGAPLSDSLAGGWSSKMSAGQAGDFMKYHAGQRGGSLAGAPVSSIGQGLPSSMHAAAMTAGTMKAYAAIAGLKDQAGGRRKRKNKKSKKQRKSRSKRSKSQRRTRQRGGSKLEFAPVSATGMLLSDYSKTGLSPQWNGGVEFSAAAARQAM